jgi:hypothetical protein
MGTTESTLGKRKAAEPDATPPSQMRRKFFCYSTELPIFEVESQNLRQTPGWVAQAKVMKTCNLALLEAKNPSPTPVRHIQTFLFREECNNLFGVFEMDPKVKIVYMEKVIEHLTLLDPHAENGLRHAVDTMKRLDQQFGSIELVSLLALKALVLLHRFIDGLKNHQQMTLETWFEDMRLASPDSEWGLGSPELSEQAIKSAKEYGLPSLLFTAFMTMMFKMEMNCEWLCIYAAAWTFCPSVAECLSIPQFKCVASLTDVARVKYLNSLRDDDRAYAMRQFGSRLQRTWARSKFTYWGRCGFL